MILVKDLETQEDLNKNSKYNEITNSIISHLDESEDFFSSRREIFEPDDDIFSNKIEKKRLFNRQDSTDENIEKDYLFYLDKSISLMLPKIELFKIKKYQKRGRIVKKNIQNASKSFLKKRHEKYDNDNVQTKVQIHFSNFLINLANDFIHAEFNCKDISFKPISYKVKKQIKSEYLNYIFQKPIKYIIKENISLKYKNYEFDYNRNLCEDLSKKSKLFADFLEMKYIDVFNRYYYNKKAPLDSIEFNDRKINLSEKTKSYCDLLKKENILEKEIKNLVETIYLFPYKNKTFIVSKNDN